MTLESPLTYKEIQPVHPKGDQSWMFIGRTDAEAETPILWPPHMKSWLIGKYLDAGRDWGAGGEGDDRGWGIWMASLTRWTWVWENSGSWWWTGRPGMLQFMGLQRVRHDWATELNWTELIAPNNHFMLINSGSMHLTFLDTTYEQDHKEFEFCFWLISLSIMFSKFIHVVTNGRISFF